MPVEAKITDLTAAPSNPVSGSLFEMTYDPSGTPTTYKASMTQVSAGVATILGLTLGAAFTTTPANTITLTTTGATNVTLPTSGTLVNSAVATLSSLVSIGTITTGTWNGTVIGSTYGGTGVNNGSSTITLGGALTLSGGFTTTLTVTGNTSVTLPTSGTLLSTAAAITVAQGGTGRATLTDHGVLIGAGTTAITQLAVAAAGTLLGGVAGADPAFTSTPTLGIAGTTLGSLALAGNTSGVVTITPQAAAGTFNFNLPVTAGTTGQFLTSAGGVGSPMTWTSVPGSDTQVIFNDGGVLGADAGLTYDKTGDILTTTSGYSISTDLHMRRRAAASFQLGAADAATSVAQTIGVQSIVAGTTDIAGSTWTFRSGVGTGTGAGGGYIFQTAPAGGSGSSQNALVTSLQLDVSGSTGNGLQISSNNTPLIRAIGPGTNIDVQLSSKGTGNVSLYTGAGTREQVRIPDTASATRYLTLTGSNGANPTIGTSAGSLALSPVQTIIASATATPAGGTTGTGLAFGTTSNFGVFYGSGAPSLSAGQGSLYLRSDGTGVADRAYVNTNGSTTWTAITTIA